MTIQTVVSVVRRQLSSLPFWLIVTGCTMQHTGELSRQMYADLGLRRVASVSRSATWTLPDHAVVYLAAPELSSSLKSRPRLHLELNKALEAEVQERFARYEVATSGQSLTESLSAAASNQCNLLLQLSLRRADDNLSSATEWMDDRGFAETATGRDHLQLMLKIFDVHSGRLLDTLSVDSRSGWWRWREHPVAELVEPALSAMFEQLRVQQLARNQP